MSVAMTASRPWRPSEVARDAPIRLLKAVTLFGVGGTERQFTNLALALDPSRYDLRVACLKQWGFFLKDFEARQIPVHEFPIRSFYRLGTLAEQVRFGRHLRREAIQIVHAYNFYGNMFAVAPARLVGTPVVIATVNDLGIYLTPMRKRAQRLVCRLADAIIVNATAIKQAIVSEGYSPERIVVIHNGVDLARIGDVAPNHCLHDQYGLPLDAPLIGVIGRLSPMKGLEDFLHAATIIRQHWPTARFVVVGAGQPADEGTRPADPYREHLQRLAAALGLGDRVIFTGFRPDVPTVLAGLTVSVLPSHSEGLSNALLESMAVGAPLVATDVGGTSEAVTDGETGLLVPPGKPAAIAEAVSRLLGSPTLAARLGYAARQRIMSEFSLARLVSTTEALYRRLLLESRRPGAGTRAGPDGQR